MDAAVRARMIDASLPYVAGRRLHTYGLSEDEARSLAAHADVGAEARTLVALGDVPQLEMGVLVLLLLPGVIAPPELAGVDIIEVQYAFRMPYGLADDTAPPTLGPDAEWPYSRLGAGVWLDTAIPNEPIGSLVIGHAT